ncbi:hypothetical protein, partial [Nocardia cyriacigeorgica]|uniref:hypothetical protein n=1 Tax=Nocardia cyriacigeorgica TaxID=135487 RepID=UPI002457DEAD
MERGSSKHGPKRDDELAHELQGTLKGNRSRGGGGGGRPRPPPPPAPPRPVPLQGALQFVGEFVVAFRAVLAASS